jgi:hypothetical protein
MRSLLGSRKARRALRSWNDLAWERLTTRARHDTAWRHYRVRFGSAALRAWKHTAAAAAEILYSAVVDGGGGREIGDSRAPARPVVSSPGSQLDGTRHVCDRGAGGLPLDRGRQLSATPQTSGATSFALPSPWPRPNDDLDPAAPFSPMPPGLAPLHLLAHAPAVSLQTQHEREQERERRLERERRRQQSTATAIATATTATAGPFGSPPAAAGGSWDFNRTLEDNMMALVVNATAAAATTPATPPTATNSGSGEGNFLDSEAGSGLSLDNRRQVRVARPISSSSNGLGGSGSSPIFDNPLADLDLRLSPDPTRLGGGEP